jgi:hypothetical protein
MLEILTGHFQNVTTHQNIWQLTREIVMFKEKVIFKLYIPKKSSKFTHSVTQLIRHDMKKVYLRNDRQCTA